MKDQEVKVYFRWEVMSTVGFYYADMVEIGKLQTPEKYTTTGKRSYSPGPSNRKNNYWLIINLNERFSPIINYGP